MTVKDIASNAAIVLQADDIAELLERATAAEDTDERTAASTDPDVKTLVKCVNLAVAELCTELPVVYATAATAEGGLIPLSALPAGLSTVRAVKRRGTAVHFTLSVRGIAVDGDGEYTVEYTLAPTDGDLTDEVALGVGADADVVCYLAARNYCLVTGRNDEASVWDQRYCAEAEKRRLLRRARLPKRAWV